jgi:hypothetical protein
LPENLDALCPDILPAVPTDPFSDKPMRYAKTPQGWKLWSVGEDNTDHGGQGDPAPGKVWNGPDYVFISHIPSNLELRSRPRPAPAPATPATTQEPAASGQPAGIQSGDGTPQKSPVIRHFVRIVVSKDAMTFEGKPTTWDELLTLLEKVPDRSHTVLQLAWASDQLTLAEFNPSEYHASTMVKQFGFEYLSRIGLHPLGSKAGDESKGPAEGH